VYTAVFAPASIGWRQKLRVPGGAERFPRVSAEMMDPVDRADAARLSMQDILRLPAQHIATPG